MWKSSSSEHLISKSGVGGDLEPVEGVCLVDTGGFAVLLEFGEEGFPSLSSLHDAIELVGGVSFLVRNSKLGVEVRQEGVPVVRVECRKSVMVIDGFHRTVGPFLSRGIFSEEEAELGDTSLGEAEAVWLTADVGLEPFDEWFDIGRASVPCCWLASFNVLMIGGN